MKFDLIPRVLTLTEDLSHRRRFYILASATFLSGIFEAVAIGLGYPTAKLLISGESNQSISASLYPTIDKEILFFGFIFFLTASLWSRAIVNHLQYKFSHCICNFLETKLLSSLVFFDIQDFFGRSLEQLRAANSVLITNTITHTLQPILQLCGHIPLVFLTISTLVFLNPEVMFPTIVGIVLIYGFVFLIVRNRLVKLGDAAVSGHMHKSSEFEKIVSDPRTYLTANSREPIEVAHANASLKEHYNSALSASLSLQPRYLIESVIYLAVTVFYFYLRDSGVSISEIGPLIAVLLLSVLRVVPSIQIIFQNLAQIRNIQSSVNTVVDVFRLASQAKKNNDMPYSRSMTSTDLVVGSPAPYLGNLVFRKGLTCVRGVSGSGKTTLLDVMAGVRSHGVMNLNSLTLDLDSQKINLVDLPSSNRRMLCEYSPQFPVSFSPNVYESVLFRPIETIDSTTISRIDQILSRLRFDPSSKSTESKQLLSGGEKKKISICRVLLSKKLVAIFDEPTAGLDDSSIDGFLGLLSEYLATSNRIFIIATHDDRFERVAKFSYTI